MKKIICDTESVSQIIFLFITKTIMFLPNLGCLFTMTNLFERKYSNQSFKKGGSKKKIPTYFAANQSNQDQIEQTPVLCRECLLEATKLLIFKQKKNFQYVVFSLDP